MPIPLAIIVKPTTLNMTIKMKQTTIILVPFLGLIYYTSCSISCFTSNSDKSSNNKHKEKVTIITKWQMPSFLNEISGICWVDEERIACVPDEQGIVFIYNISSAKIENQIQFADSGDFEAITKTDDAYYVMRSDGHIFEINTSLKKTVVKQYHILINEPNDIEGLFYDETEKRFLIVNRLPDPQAPTKKSIYSFDLSTKKLIDKPIYEIDLSGILIIKENDEDKKEVFLPSDIAIHPITSDIYLVDGIHSSIQIIDATGKIKSYIKLDKNDFPKPEGLTFSPKGDIFISSEGIKQNGFIAKVKIENIID
jgi:uncharacterized protein YjiK